SAAEGVRGAGIEADRLIEIGYGVVDIPLGRIGAAPAIIALSEIGIDRERLGGVADRAVVIPFGKIGCAPAVEQDGRSRIERDRLIIVREGANDIAFVMIGPAAVAQGHRENLAGEVSRLDGLAASDDLLFV